MNQTVWWFSPTAIFPIESCAGWNGYVCGFRVSICPTWPWPASRSISLSLFNHLSVGASKSPPISMPVAVGLPPMGPPWAPWGSTQHPDGWLPIPVRTPAVRRGGRSPLPTGEEIKSMIPYEPHIILADETCSKAYSVRLSYSALRLVCLKL